MLLVAAAAIIRHGEILLVRKKAKPKTWIFPGGVVEENENPEEGLTRELSEELPGMEPTGFRPLGIYRGRYPRKEGGVRVVVYRATYKGRFAKGDELAELRWFSDPGKLRLAAPTARAIQVLRERGYL